MSYPTRPSHAGSLLDTPVPRCVGTIRVYTCSRSKSRLSNSGPIISAHDLSKKFGVAPLFKNISFTVSEGDRIGLIGPNGSGKSTLLEILYRRVKPDSGEVDVRKRTRLSSVAQNSEFPEGATIRSVITAALDRAEV